MDTIYDGMIRDAGEVYSVQYTKKSGRVYRSVYCIYICILTCYTTLSSINTSRLQYCIHFSRFSRHDRYTFSIWCRPPLWMCVPM